MAQGGRAMTKSHGQIIFVPYTIPGEKISAEITQSKGKVAFAKGKMLLEASGDRVAPRCPHFGPGRCWGCQWQHIDYPAQLLLKQDVLADQLSRIGGLKDSILEEVMNPVLPSQEQWGYNSHMTLERDSHGNFGFRREQGGTIEPISECHILHPDLLALYDTINLDFGGIRRMGLQRGSDGATMIQLTLTDEDAPELSADFPTSVNVILPDNEPVNLIGDAYVNYIVKGRSFRVTAGSFFRPNIPQVENLVDVILQMADLTGEESILDLYAGVGLFSAFLADKAQLVTMVESYPPAVTDADVNLEAFDNVDVIEGGVEGVIESLIENEAEYDIAIIDPPSRGLSQAVLDV